MAAQPPQQRITLVAGELLGHVRTGGLGTATTHLAVALGRRGHRVEVLYTGEPPRVPVADEWLRLYADAGVEVRPLPRAGGAVEPAFFAQIRDVERALRDDPPDVVITQDLAAPAYASLRLRSLGLGFERTLFVVYCHGTRQWITDVSRKVRVLPGALAITALERASLELADAVVSPSAYLVDWMRDQGWRLPGATQVIPYLTRSTATGEPASRAAGDGGPVERVVFFGRLEERKGIRPFAAGLDALEPELLSRIEVELVGRATPAWPPERVEALLSAATREALRGLSFHTDLDQSEALARLARPGTVAVLPSLEDNSPNTVYECLEHGIPFLAGNAGGGAELVAPGDRAAALVEPTAAGVEAGLRRVLADGARPARPAFDQDAALEAWAEIVARRPAPPNPAPADADGWVTFPDDLDDGLRETLARAQRASGADVVTCAVHVDGGADHYFVGEPGALGLLANGYGTVALIRRPLLADAGAADSAWVLLARLSAAGARIVSIPLPLATSARAGSLERDPADALLVAQALERAAPDALRSAARLVAGLAADAQAPARGSPGLARRARAVLRRSLVRR